MKLRSLVKEIEKIVPKDWAMPKDPIGLQIGDGEKKIERVMVGLEVSRELLKKAKNRKADMLLVHHPLIYFPLTKLIQSDPVQRLVRQIVQREMALYAMHTNFDLHPEGMGKVWAQKLGCMKITPLSAKPQANQLKIVTFVTPEHTDGLRAALSKAGAGIVGDYEQCSFTLRGEGTFFGTEGTSPYVGQAGSLEKEEEERVEMVLPRAKKQAVVKALFETHPYEEPAYDLYPLEDVRDVSQAVWIGEFRNKLTWKTFKTKVFKSLPWQPTLQSVQPNKRKQIKRIAISTGSGDGVLPIVAGLDVDAYLTGELGYHLMWEANEMGLNVLLAGHGASESLFAETVIPLLKENIKDVSWQAEN